ncbi:uncharacterized protein [Ptychodera flava]|uniref:uncharacterized protein n=1 Tax=Ptychodera flava TaxID=63121 RepID=UPI00396AB0B1
METSTANQPSNKSSGVNEEMKLSVGREELKQTVCLLACSLGESEVNKKDEAILDAIHRLNRIITQGGKMIQFASPSQPGPSPQESDSQKPETDVPTDSPVSDVTAEELSGQLPNPARPGVTMVTRNGEINGEMLLECYNGSDDTDLEDYYGIQAESRDSLSSQQGKLSRGITLPPSLSNGIGMTRGMISGIMHPLKISNMSRRKHERQTFTCYKCKERIVCVTNFEKHMMEAHNIGKPWECRFCPGRRFHRLILLEHHYNTMHKNNGEGRRKYTQRQFICDLCHEVVTYVSKFEAHMLEKHGVRKPWRCDQCVNYAAATYHLYMWHVQQYHPNITKHHLEISTVVNNTITINSTNPQALTATTILAPQRPTIPVTLAPTAPTEQRH